MKQWCEDVKAIGLVPLPTGLAERMLCRRQDSLLCGRLPTDRTHSAFDIWLLRMAHSN